MLIPLRLKKNLEKKKKRKGKKKESPDSPLFCPFGSIQASCFFPHLIAKFLPESASVAAETGGGSASLVNQGHPTTFNLIDVT